MFELVAPEASHLSCLTLFCSNAKQVGHVYSLGFDFDAQDKDKRKDPREYFRLPVTKKEESTTAKLRVVDHLR